MAGRTTNINIRVNETLKTEAEILFKELGMNLSSAINMFLTQSVRNQAIPFEITKNTSSANSVSPSKPNSTFEELL